MEQRNQKEFMYENINDIVLNKVKTRKFYQKRSKIFAVNIFMVMDMAMAMIQ